MLELKKVEENDIDLLVDIKKRAFKEEFRKYGFTPEDMITKKWHINMSRKSTYYAIKYDGLIVGGVNVFGRNGEYYLCSIFIDSMHQRKGFGKETIKLLEKKYDDWKKWQLETPSASKQNHCFYQKCGYTYIKEIIPKNAPDNFSLWIYEKVR